MYHYGFMAETPGAMMGDYRTDRYFALLGDLASTLEKQRYRQAASIISVGISELPDTITLRLQLDEKMGQRRRGAIKGNELSEADRALARRFGYKPVFRREFGFLSSFSFAVSISGLFSTVAVGQGHRLFQFRFQAYRNLTGHVQLPNCCWW